MKNLAILIALLGLLSLTTSRATTQKNKTSAVDGASVINYVEKAHDVNRKLEIKKSRTWTRKRIIENKVSAPIPENELDEVMTFVDSEEFYTNIFDLDQKIPRTAKVDTIPWSDDYWPLYKGSLGSRYADPNMPEDNDWKINFDYIKENNISKILSMEDEEKRNSLSPAEKYDLIFGLVGQGLTEYNWLQGYIYYKNYDEVETWMGICHGWAAAATMVDHAHSAVDVMGMDGKKVKLYPSDIKSYISLLWANTATPHQTLGDRCGEKESKNDENGRTQEDECFDVNPGMWHLATLHQIGLANRTFVIDATYDYQVWNQPMIRYGYRYFNVATGDHSINLQDSIVELASLTHDPYKKYRSPKAKYIVGVAMDIEYAVETYPRHQETETPVDFASNFAQYVYDLELDENYNILGGEWHFNLHPDFMWKVEEGTEALAVGDYQLLGVPLWEGENKFSNHWRYQAYLSAQRGQPLNRFIQSLFKIMGPAPAPSPAPEIDLEFEEEVEIIEEVIVNNSADSADSEG